MQLNEKDRKYRALGIRIMSEFGAAIALPVVLLVILGVWIDKKFGTGPIFKIAGFAISFVASSIIVYKKTKMFSKMYNDIEIEGKNNYDSSNRS